MNGKSRLGTSTGAKLDGAKGGVAKSNGAKDGAVKSESATGNGQLKRSTSRSEAGRARIDIESGDAVIRPLKTSERVARDIVRDIIDRGLSTGDGLPAEAAMLDHYGVSRESLREGLRLLEVQGLITLRRGPGGGPIVGSVDPANLGRVSSLYFHMAGATYRELFEAWILAEGILAGRAARNPDADLRREVMRPYVVDPASFVDPEEMATYLHSQVEFHGAVARLGGNRVLELSMQLFGQIASHHFALEHDPRMLHTEIGDSHRDLAAAIIAGRPGRATAVMLAHLEWVADLISSRMGSGVDDYIEWR